MQRRDATQLLRRIIDFPDIIPFTCVYLTGSEQLGTVELHVKTDRDSVKQTVIEHIARQEGLHVRDEPGGFLGIYTPKTELLELTA